MSEKPTVAIGLLSGCFGCLMSFLDMEELVPILDKVELRRTPFNDIKEVEDVTIGILEGAISTDENLAFAKEMREKSQILISLGTCATYGGIPGLRNFSDKDDFLAAVYGNKIPDSPDIPSLLPKVMPVPQAVKVDVEIRGCPPTSADIAATLAGLLEGKEVKPMTQNLCIQCPRTKHKILSPSRGFLTEGVRAVMELEEIDPTICMLEQGVLCMGIVTAAGCGSRCPKNNMPCRGCFGPVPGVHSQGNKAIDTLASLIPPGALMFFEDCVGTGYRFTAAYDQNLKVEKK